MTRSELLVEIAVVLCLAFLPHLASALMSHPDLPFAAHHVLLAVMSVQVAAPLLYILQPWSRFGVVRPSLLVDLFSSFVLFGCVYALPPLLMSHLAKLVTISSGSATSSFPRPESGGDYVLLVPSLLLSAFAEELAWRGYLIPRLSQLGIPRAIAVLVSGALFASYHAYQGAWVMIWIFLDGLLLGLFFFVVPRLWPLTVAHVALNLVYYLSSGP